MKQEDDDQRLERLATLAEQFCDELRTRGTDVEEYAARYPELAEEIREYFPSLEVLEVAGKRYSRAVERCDWREQIESLQCLRSALDGRLSLSERITQRFGAETHPHTTLNGREEAHADFVSEVLKRIGDRQGSYARYELRGEVGRGGQGAILVVWDEDLRRNLAMKVVLGETDDDGHETPVDSRTLGRFLEEAQVTGQLDHPGIVPVHELGLDDVGRVYFTMKLVKGRDLRKIFELAREEEEEWTLTRALGVMLKVCEALAYAHSKGVIHRDLKPSNVMVGKFGEVYVMDWGLARVLGAEDRKDIHIQPDVSEEIRSPRHAPSGNGDASLVTMDGDVVGTPAYMSPEQASGDLEAMGAHSDVYSVGAMLYQLLTGRVPYVPEDARLNNRKVWLLVQGGPPEPVFRLAPNLPAELVAICEKAMARQVGERYRDTSELADDLRAFLENRVVSAYRTGALVELRKWIERNKPLAASIAAVFAAVVAGLATSVVLKNQSDAYAKEASETALREQQRADEVLRLSASQDLIELKREADELWPPGLDMKERYEDWLDRAHELVAGLDPDPETGDIGHLARLADLEARALPYTDEQRERDLRTNSRFRELEEMKAYLAFMELGLAVRDGTAEFEEVELDEDQLPDDPEILLDLAYRLLHRNRTVYGREAEGLALGLLALDRAEDDETYVEAVSNVSLAYYLLGHDDEGLAVLDDALFVVSDEYRPELESFRASHLAAMGRIRGQLEEEIPHSRAHVELLERDLASQRTRSFPDERDRWWYAQLVRLVVDIEFFSHGKTGLIEGISDEHGWGVARRLAWANEVEERTVSGDEAKRLWAEAITSIANPLECPAYGGLEIEPQVGLLPIGRDPRSGLWEFAHPLTGDVPVRGEDGRLVTTEEMGLVFVLLPGGSFMMGAQASDPEGPNYDPLANLNENPPHEVILSPFFLSKYEMAQGPWVRFTGKNPSAYQPGGSIAPSLLHPVEQVSWTQSELVCRRLGFALPTEAQWEYALRGGTTTPWWTGTDEHSLDGTINLADLTSVRKVQDGEGTLREHVKWLDDGYSAHAPVDTLEPNPFGLHHMAGNLWEWCADGYDSRFYWQSPRRDPFRDADGLKYRVNRGGGFVTGYTSYARSSYRFGNMTETAQNTLGFRPARALEGEHRL